MRYFRLLLLLVLSTYLSACAGTRIPFTDYRLANWQVEIDRDETNSSCTDLETLTAATDALETQHLKFIRTRDFDDAVAADILLASLGEKCQPRFTRLSTPEIKNELFGDIQTISDSAALRELGGLAFEYQDVSTKGGVEISLHLDRASKGPKRRIVGVYRLEDGKVLHFNYSGTDNVDKKSRSWPLDAFFKAAAGAASKALIP